jgi:hypothetical protein
MCRARFGWQHAVADLGHTGGRREGTEVRAQRQIDDRARLWKQDVKNRENALLCVIESAALFRAGADAAA